MWTILACPSFLKQVSKTGDQDLSLALDSVWIQFLMPIVEQLSKGSRSQKVFPFSYGQFLKVFVEAKQRLQISQLVPYQMRHSGASIDYAMSYRTTSEIQRRGGWRQAKSVARYERSGRLGHSMMKYTASQIAHFENCERMPRMCSSDVLEDHSSESEGSIHSRYLRLRWPSGQAMQQTGHPWACL